MSDAEYIKTRVIKWLLEGNLSFDKSKDAIGTEVPFSHNRRRADLLILSKEMHALEIKGDLDNLGKLAEQLDDYHKTFDKVSVVITYKHLPRIYEIIRPYTGLILSHGNTFKTKRMAIQRKRLDKYSLLMFLPKSKLTGLIKVPKSRNLSTDEMRRLIAERLTTEEIRKATYSSLMNRYSKLFRLFLSDTDGNIIWDELKGLCGRIDDLY